MTDEMLAQFQIRTDEIEDFRDEFRTFRQSGGYDNRPPPLIIETYLDASRLNSSQSLVVLDDNGKRSDVLEALNTSESSSGSNSPSRPQRRNTEVILERWRVELKGKTDGLDDFGPVLPNIYKRSIVFFRSLYIMTQLLPASKFSQQCKALHPGLEVKCRIVTEEHDDRGFDPLRQPLFDDGRDPVTEYMFGDMEIPVGRFLSSITYRNDCNFRVDSSESLLSSRFMGVDENFFKPTLPQQRGDYGRTEGHTEVGSLPAHMRGRDGREAQQTYGSLSTFHGAGALGTSPISALRAVRPAGSDTSSMAGSVPGSIDHEPSHSLPIRSGQSSISRPSLRNYDSSRRPSVSQAINPFKNGSVSGSPRMGEGDSPSSPSQSSHSRTGSYSGFSQNRANRSSLTAGMAASLRGGPPPASSVGDQPLVGSPKPPMTSRYSSSFTHRRGRLSFGGGQSRPGDDDQASSGSGRQSLSSSAQPGSGLLTEAGGAASSGSFQADDDNLSEFLKALDSRKTLKSFEPNSKGEASAAKRTAAQLSKFAMMRESNNALTESMTSSMHLQRSSSSSSRQLANVPAMVNPASMSTTSSSPGIKPLSPHTPHTPAIPSRLSENSIVDYPVSQRHGSHRLATTADTVSEADADVEGGEDTQVPVSQEGTTAIDIPLSPRVLQAVGSTNRRASSVAHQNRASAAEPPLPEDDDSDILGQRSISLGADGRKAPTLSSLLGMQRSPQGHNAAKNPTSGQAVSSLRQATNIRPSSSSTAVSSGKTRDSEEPKNDSPGSHLLSGAPYRPRYSSRGSAGGVRPSSSRGSFSGGSGPRYGDGADDEPLVFAMSELERDSRRSLEEHQGRGSSSAGPGSGGRREERSSGFEPRGTSRRGW